MPNTSLPRVYLAGPMGFYPDPEATFEIMKILPSGGTGRRRSDRRTSLARRPRAGQGLVHKDRGSRLSPHGRVRRGSDLS